MTTISTKNGKIINVINADESKASLTSAEQEMDIRAVAAVDAAINRAKICKNPIAKYDAEKKVAYIEYANGDRKYAK